MLKTSSLPRPFLAALVLSSFGCSAKTTSTSDSPDAFLSVPGQCGAYDHEPCDTTLADCQARLAEMAACQWGGPEAAVVMPSVTVATPDEVEERFAELASDSEGPPSAVDEVLTLLGLIESGDLEVMETIERQAAGTAAFYEFEARTITVVDRDEVDLRSANGTLLHEYLHALQNERHELLALQQEVVPTLDSITALRALFEGEASFHEVIFYLGQEGAPLTSTVFERFFSIYRTTLESTAFEQPDVFLNTNTLMPYIHGAAWAYAEWTRGGSAVVQSRYEVGNLPTSTLSILQLAWGEPEDTTGVAEFPMANVFYDDAPPPEDSELIPVGTDRLGAFTTYVMARIHTDGTHFTARDLALDWRGDQLDVFELDAGGAAGRWTVSFQSEASAQILADALDTNPNLSVRREGGTLVAAIVPGGAAPEWLFGVLSR